MSVTIISTTQIDQDLYKITFNSDEVNPRYYIYVNGVLHSIQTEEEIIIKTNPSETLKIEIYDDETEIPAIGENGNVIINLDKDQNVAKYEIYKLGDTEYELVQVVDNKGLRAPTYISPLLEDEEEHKYKVYAVGFNNNKSKVRDFSIFVVRPPDVPSLSQSYDEEDGEVTFDDA